MGICSHHWYFFVSELFSWAREHADLLCVRCTNSRPCDVCKCSPWSSSHSDASCHRGSQLIISSWADGFWREDCAAKCSYRGRFCSKRTLEKLLMCRASLTLFNVTSPHCLSIAILEGACSSGDGIPFDLIWQRIAIFSSEGDRFSF